MKKENNIHENNNNNSKKKITPFEAFTLIISLIALVNSLWPVKEVILPFKLELVTPQYIYMEISPTSPYLDIYVPIEILNVSSRDGVIRNIMVSLNEASCDRCSDFNRSDVRFVTKSFLSRYPEDKHSYIAREAILPKPLAKGEGTTIVLWITYPVVDEGVTFTDELLELKIAFLLNNDETMEYYTTPIQFQISHSMVLDLLQDGNGELLEVNVENYIQK